MNADHLLDHAAQLGIRLETDGETIFIDPQRGRSIPRELIAALKAHRAALIPRLPVVPWARRAAP